MPKRKPAPLTTADRVKRLPYGMTWDDPADASRYQWQHDGALIDITQHANHYVGFVYLLTGKDPASGRDVAYIGKHERFEPNYCGSGVALDQFPDRNDWMKKHVLQFTDEPLRAEYECQMDFKDEIIDTDNFVDGGRWLNLQILSPDGESESFFHPSREWNRKGSTHGKGGKGGGSTQRPVVVEYTDGRPAVTFESVKAAEQSVGSKNGNGSTIWSWLVDPTGKFVVDPDTPLGRRYRRRSPATTWKKYSIKRIFYA